MPWEVCLPEKWSSLLASLICEFEPAFDCLAVLARSEAWLFCFLVSAKIGFAIILPSRKEEVPEGWKAGSLDVDRGVVCGFIFNLLL